MKSQKEIQNRIEMMRKSVKVAPSRTEKEVNEFSDKMLAFVLTYYTKEELISNEGLCNELNNLIYEYKNYISVDNWAQKLFSKFGPAEKLICHISENI